MQKWIGNVGVLILPYTMRIMNPKRSQFDQTKKGFSNSWNFSKTQEFKALMKTVKPVSNSPQKLGVFLPMSNNKGLILVANNYATKTGYSKKEYFNGIKKEVRKN